MNLNSIWLKKLLPLLTVYFCWTYLDPNLPFYMSNRGIYADQWPLETKLLFDSEYLKLLLNVFAPLSFQIVTCLGLLCSFGFLLPNKRIVFLSATAITLIIQSLFMLRNPSFYVIHRPYLGMLLLFLPFALWQTRRTLKLLPMDWLWVATSITYLTAALSKLSEPLWLGGSALAELKGFPVRSELLLNLSSDSFLCQLLTYSVVGAELLHGILGYFPRFRFLAWSSVFLLHLAALPILQIYVATVPMLLFHLFLFNPEWIKIRFFWGRWIKSP